MAEYTPESDLGSIECFQNYTASEVFIQGLAGIVHQQDVESMIRAQKQMLQRFEKTNEMLINCNTLSATRLKSATIEFKKHTTLLSEMRKDLDNIFKRIQTLKTRTSSAYPKAYAAVPTQIPNEEVKVQNNNQNVESTNKVKEFLKKHKLKRTNSSSSESVNGSHNDSSPYTSDTG